MKFLGACLVLASLFFSSHLLSQTLPKSEKPSEKEDSVKTPLTIEVKRTDPNFVIELRSNPGTGYSWFLSRYDHELVQPVKKEYEASNKKLVGSGGKERWFFRLKPKAFIVPNILTIEMVYARPWSLEDAPKSKTFKIVAHPVVIKSGFGS